MKYVLEDKRWGLAAQPGVENEGISQSSHNELVIKCSHTVSTCKSFKIASVSDKNVSQGARVVAVTFLQKCPHRAEDLKTYESHILSKNPSLSGH